VTGWESTPAFGSPVPQAVIEAIRAAEAPRSSTSTWIPVDPVTIASGTGAVGETTVALSPTVVVPAQTVAVEYQLQLVVGGGTGKASLSVSHKPGGVFVGAVEATPTTGTGVYATPLVDINGGRLTYAVTFVSSPTSVSWIIRVVGFLRSA
jgi:hypothetical protein